MKELAQKTKETESKQRLAKSQRRSRAVDMKGEAFRLVQEERKYKAFEGYKAASGATAKLHETLLKKKWVAEDKKTKSYGNEKETKRQIDVEMMGHEVQRKLVLEKEEKGPPPKSAESVPEEKTKLPPPPPPAKTPKATDEK